jgi:hypothetical protein
MKIRLSEATPRQIDYLVARCEGDEPCKAGGTGLPYSTDWLAAGPIIEREGISLYLYGGSEWNAHVGGKESIGPTPLIAAMRCYVASKMGDEVKASAELQGGAK